jgi:uncharacterized OB-fold protein
MEDYRFSDKRAYLRGFTGDNLAFSLAPPAIYGRVEFEGGGVYYFDITDTDLESVKVDMPVEMSLRKKYTDPRYGWYDYFWKAVPVRE